jgi:flagellar assembly protein FliH
MTIAKFEIETVFSTGKEGYDPERESYERKIEIVRNEAYDLGFKEGHAKALVEIEARTEEAMGKVHVSLVELFATRQGVEKNLEVQSIQLAHLTAKKLVSNLIKKYPTEEIETLIYECLMSGYNEPKIVIRASEELLNSITDRVNKMAETTGFQGEISIISDPSFSNLDCSVEWPNGGVSRNLALLEKQIQTKIENYIEGPLDEVVIQSIEDNLATPEEDAEVIEVEDTVEDVVEAEGVVEGTDENTDEKIIAENENPDENNQGLDEKEENQD